MEDVSTPDVSSSWNLESEAAFARAKLIFKSSQGKLKKKKKRIQKSSELLVFT